MDEYVLLIEDEQDIQTQLVSFLETFKLKKYVTNSVNAGKDFLTSNNKDIALVILGISENNNQIAMNLLTYIKENFPLIGVILISKHPKVETVVQAIRLGAEDYIEKPVNIDLLSNSINKILHKLKLSKKAKKIEDNRSKFHKELSHVLNKTSNLLASFIQSSKEGIFITDDNGFILEVNKAFTEMFKYSPRDIIGKKFDLIFSKKTPSKTIEEIWKSIKDPKKLYWTGELTNEAKDSSTIDIILSVSSVTNTQAEITNHIGIIYDNTARKLIETQFNILEDIKSKFIGITAHELRTPIHQLTMTYNIIKNSPCLPPELSDILFKSAQSVKRLKIIVDTLMEFIEFSTQNFKLNLTLINVLSLIKKIIQNITQNSPNVSVTFDLSRLDKINILGDYSKIEECLKQIIHNAIKFSKDGGVIEIFSEDEYHIVVKDDGLGIPTDVMERVFEPFYEEQKLFQRDSDSTKHVGKGLGLGLTLCQLIINAHNGKIWVNSLGKNKGTEIHINFPQIIR